MTKLKLQKLITVGAVAFLPAWSAAAATFSPAGSGAPVATSQPSIALHPYIRVGGPPEKLGEIRWYAGAGGLRDGREFVKADGRTLQIVNNPLLFATVGAAYGGDGTSTFNLPDLRGRTVKGGTRNQLGTLSGSTSVALTGANLPSHVHDLNGTASDATGGGQSFSVEQPSITLAYEVQTIGSYPGAFVPGETIGGINMTASIQDNNFTTTDANGNPQLISQNTALFSLFGTIHGGDGEVTFDVPDVAGKIVTGAGSGPGRTPRALGGTMGSDEKTLTKAQMPAHAHQLGSDTSSMTGGSQPVSLIQEEVALNWIIALIGIFPTGADTLGFGFEPVIGEMSLFGGNFAPRGWAFAHGQLLPINSNQALFSLLGTTYGGDGETTFALPDMRGRTAVGSGPNHRIGTVFGSETTVLTQQQLPSHTHDITLPPSPVPLPGAVMLMFGGIGALGAAKRLTRTEV